MQRDLQSIQKNTPKQIDVESIRTSLINLRAQTEHDVNQIQTTLTSLQETVNTLPTSKEVENIKIVIVNIQKTLQSADSLPMAVETKTSKLTFYSSQVKKI